MEKRKKLSIVIPVYKVEKYLKRCFECLESQLSEEIEVIFVDDGSPDLSGEMCDEYSKGKSNVKVIHKLNGGLADARNTGLSFAVGEYCMFLDSDDTIVENSCNEIIKNLYKEQIDILYLNINWIKEDETLVYSKKNLPNNIILNGKEALKLELKSGKYAAMSQMGIYRTSFLKENNLLFKKGILHEDEEWSPRVILKANKVKKIAYSYYNYYIRENSITQTKNIKRYYDLIDTVYSLKEIYINLEDKSLKSYGIQYVGKLYMNAVANIIVSGENYNIDTSFFKHLYGLKNKMKILIFMFSPRLFLKFMR